MCSLAVQCLWKQPSPGLLPTQVGSSSKVSRWNGLLAKFVAYVVHLSCMANYDHLKSLFPTCLFQMLNCWISLDHVLIVLRVVLVFSYSFMPSHIVKVICLEQAQRTRFPTFQPYSKTNISFSNFVSYHKCVQVAFDLQNVYNMAR
jgi:hypothetical protein